jgi:hypothetical protein
VHPEANALSPELPSSLVRYFAPIQVRSVSTCNRCA